MNWQDATVLITGGTGSLGQELTRQLLGKPVRAIRILSRDGHKQGAMRARFDDNDRLRWLIGDVRDPGRLHRALDGVDLVIHTAALKDIHACEANPFEAVNTNILGSQNVIEAAIDRGVGKVIGISSDKAVAPANLYGSTKAVMERLFSHAPSYVGSGPTRFAVIRYGNVAGSAGSVVPLWKALADSGTPLRITDRRMTRFWLTLAQAAALVLSLAETMRGGELIIPELPAVRMVDVAEAIAPGRELVEVGMRVGEKLHESLGPGIFSNEARLLSVAEIRATL